MEHHSNIVPWQLTAAGHRRGAPLHPAHRRRPARPLGPGVPAHRADEDPVGDRHVERARDDHAPRAARRGGARRGRGRRRGRGAARPAQRCRRSPSSTATSSRSAVTRCSVRRRPAACTRKAELLDAMDPMFGGGEMIHEVFHDHSTWKDIPYKFEAGTMQIAQQVGLGAAVDYLEALGMDAVRAHEEEITRYALDELIDGGRDGLRTEGRRRARRRGELLVPGRPPARPRDDPGRGGRGDPRGPPLRAARDAALRHARHGTGVVLRVQHAGRGRRAGRTRWPKPKTSSGSSVRRNRGARRHLQGSDPRPLQEPPEQARAAGGGRDEDEEQPALRRRDHRVREPRGRRSSPR